MSITKIFLKVYAIELLDCNDIINYISGYQIVFNKLIRFLNNIL